MASGRTNDIPTSPFSIETKLRLQWVAKSSPLHRKLSFNILNEVASYLLVPGLLLGIKDASVRCYNLQGGESKEGTLPRSFSDGTSYCPFGNNSVLCIGDWPDSTAVFSLQLPDYQLEQEQSTHITRGYSAVFCYRAFVYVFGGYSNNAVIKSCEKFSLAEKCWTLLPDMTQKLYCFTPCLYELDLFLADAYTAGNVLEIFNIETEVFTPLPVVLEGLSGNSVAFIDSGEVVIVTHDRQVGRWRIHSDETRFRVEEIVGDPDVFADSSFPPVQIGKEVFYVRFNTGELNVFNITTKTLTCRKV